MFNFRTIFNILGLLIAIIGLAMLIAVPFSVYFESSDLWPLVYCGVGLMAFGGIVWGVSYRSRSPELKKRDGYLIVSLGWITMALAGALPYYVSGEIPSFTDAFFESMSGFTTTGATILGQEIESLPKGLHVWRALTHWIGGMGIIVLTIAILPLLGIGGMQLYAAEVPGPTPDKLTPRIKETARRLWIIYVALTFLQVIFLMIGNMGFYDAICHSMSTLSTGGFSTRQASMGAYSPYHQYVVIVFMFLAGTNFALSYAALRGRPKKLWSNEEFRFYLYVTLFITLVVATILTLNYGYSMEKAFRSAAFQVLAILTTTGFGTDDFTAWGPFLYVMFFFLMFSGACAGSTSGGIKLVRIVVIMKNSLIELKRQIHPHAVIPVRFNDQAVSSEVVGKILAFFLVFVLLFVFGTLVMASLGLDFTSALGAVAATLGNIGPGIGIVGPSDSQNFAQISDLGKTFLSILMLLGRLELFTVLMIFTPYYWRKS